MTKVVEHRVWHFVSQISYGMYLFNPMGVWVAYRYVLPVPEEREFVAVSFGYFCLANLVVTLICVLMGMLLYLLIEKPCMEMRQLFDGERHASSKN